MTYEDFEKGLAMMSFCGFQGTDGKQIHVWFRLLEHLDPKDFELAVTDLLQTHEKWWNNDNVPGLIMGRVEKIKAKPKPDRFHIAPVQKQIMGEDFKPDPDAWKKVGLLAKGIGRETKKK